MDVQQGKTLQKTIEKMPREKELVRGVVQEEERVEGLLRGVYERCVGGVEKARARIEWWVKQFN